MKTFPRVERKMKIRRKINCIIGRVFPYPLLFTPNIKKSIPIFHSLTQNPFCSKSGKEMRFQLTCHCSGTTLCLCDHHNQKGEDTNSKHTQYKPTNKKLSSLMTMPKSSTCSFFFSKQKRVFLCFLIFSLKLTFKI